MNIKPISFCGVTKSAAEMAVSESQQKSVDAAGIGYHENGYIRRLNSIKESVERASANDSHDVDTAFGKFVIIERATGNMVTRPDDGIREFDVLSFTNLKDAVMHADVLAGKADSFNVEDADGIKQAIFDMTV